MPSVPGYKILQTVYESMRTIVYRAQSLQSDEAVILKTLKSPYPEAKDLARLAHEFEIAKDLNSAHIVNPIELVKYDNSLVLVLEDFQGTSLKNIINAQTIELVDFLKITIQLTEALAKLHEKGIIHKDLKPQNIIVNLLTEQVKIADFSIASSLIHENRAISNSDSFEGTIAYMSPEQTGRMNRAIDYRTDFYSLGVTCYEILTGQLPFPTTDPIELIHCHIAKKPALPHHLNPTIPPVLSQLVMKLMAKTAEERYQSAYGIQWDLQTCLNQLQTTGAIADFVLGQQDISTKFQICQKLYGREAEIEALMAAFDRVSQGMTELMLVAGYSGIGKTSLIHEIHKPVVRDRGYFITGKFDQYKQNIPYSAIIQAFTALIDQLLTESETQIAAWKHKLLDALGTNGQVIIDVIPEIELIIGAQPPVPTLAPAESQNRFNLILHQFITVFTQREHPLVLFLDDLQWADSASLRLLQFLTTSPRSQYLLMIGAYRDNEIYNAHPLVLTLEEIKKAKINLHLIKLQSLKLEHISHLLSDTLKLSLEQVNSLAELVFQKTDGNPFFLSQMLMTLHQEELLQFDSLKRCWQWNIEQIQAKGITDNVVELMLNKIQKLPVESQTFLKFAACIGNIFDLESLSIVTEQPLSTTATELRAALHEGLIAPLDSTYHLSFLNQVESESAGTNLATKVSYKFLHDRIQQAAYTLLSEAQQTEVHLKIGRLILMNTDDTKLDDNLFEIVSHLNTGFEHITDKAEKLRLAELNLAAGRKAKASTAYDMALQCFQRGLSVLPSQSWQQHYELTFALHKESSECAYLCGKFEQAEMTFDLLLERARTVLEKAEIYNLKILLFAFQNQASQAIKVGLESLQMLGLSIPESGVALQSQIDQELQELQERVGDRDLNAWLNAPSMTDPHQQAIIRILFYLSFPTYQTNKSLMTFNTLKMLNLSLEYGFSKESPDAFCNYAQALGSVFGDYAAANRFGKFALKLNEKIDNRQLNSKMNFWYGLCILPWREHLKLSLPHLNKGYQYGLETGDLVHLILSCYWIVMAHLILGSPLDQVCEEWERYSSVVKQNPFFYDPYCSIKGLAVSLQNSNSSEGTLSYEDFEEQAFIERTETLDVRDLNLHFYHQFKVQILYLLGHYIEALKFATESEQTLVALQETTIAPEHYFYQALTVAALYPDANSAQQQDYWQMLERNRDKLKLWADNCPENFSHRYTLIEAEMARLNGQDLAAMRYYDQAITEAQKNEYIHHAAIANELAAKFFLARGQIKIARVYLMDAHHGYAQWKAMAKVKQLEKHYSDLLAGTVSTLSRPQATTITTNTSSSTMLGAANAFDAMSIIKASQTLASEIVLRKLVQSLLKIVMENAGARTSCLLLEKDGQLIVEAMGDVEQEEVLLCQAEPIEACRALPLSIVNYVARTRESVVLANAMQDSRFATDSYIAAENPTSILCMPILNQGKLIGVLYLENNLTTNAFTADRLEVLKLLSSQIAVSLENALLYSNLEATKAIVQQANIQLEEANHTLEQKVEERTLELKEKNACLKEQATYLEQTLDKLKKTQTQLIQTEKMSSLGQLVAGVAHEINNPVNFIYGNLSHAATYTKNLLRLIQLYQESFPQATSAIHALTEEIELEFLADDLSKILNSMQVGADRIRQIVLSLRNFSRLDEAEMKPINIEEGIESTLLILQHRLSKKAEGTSKIQIIREYGDLPAVECFAGQLNQVFMNILSNAIDVLEERDRQRSPDTIQTDPSTIRIITEKIDQDHVRIRIADNGLGMTEEVQKRLFDPFFTTKPVGAGTGLGLSISYQIVVDKHGGQLYCTSAPGEWTEFAIEIPTRQQHLPGEPITFRSLSTL